MQNTGKFWESDMRIRKGKLSARRGRSIRGTLWNKVRHASVYWIIIALKSDSSVWKIFAVASCTGKKGCNCTQSIRPSILRAIETCHMYVSNVVILPYCVEFIRLLSAPCNIQFYFSSYNVDHRFLLFQEYAHVRTPLYVIYYTMRNSRENTSLLSQPNKFSWFIKRNVNNVKRVVFAMNLHVQHVQIL